VALVDGGVGGDDEQTPNVVINTPTYAGQANTCNYKTPTHMHAIEAALILSQFKHIPGSRNH